MRWKRMRRLCFRLLDSSPSSTSRVNSTCGREGGGERGGLFALFTTLESGPVHSPTASPSPLSSTSSYLDRVHSCITDNERLHLEGFAQSSCLVNGPHCSSLISIDVLPQLFSGEDRDAALLFHQPSGGHLPPPPLLAVPHFRGDPCSSASWKELASVSVPARPRFPGQPGESIELDEPGWMPWVRCD